MLRKQNPALLLMPGMMATPDEADPPKIRPDHIIKLFTPSETTTDQYNVLKELKSAKGIVLQLRENIRGNVFNRPFPFIIIRRIPATEKLPENLKFDGDPLSDYFVTVKCIRRAIEGCSNILSLTSTPDSTPPVSGYVVLAFKVLNDDQTSLFDKTWHEWTGASLIIADLAKVYPIRKVACYKGVNVVPDVFKYYIFIEFLMTDDTAKSQDELFALDCIQKFRIRRMCGYAAVYAEYNDAAIAKAMEDNETLGAILQSVPDKIESLTIYQI